MNIIAAPIITILIYNLIYKSRAGPAICVKSQESLFLLLELCANENLALQDGQIDYGEFAAMMRKGNVGMGRRTMRSKLNLGNALGLVNMSNELIDCPP